MTSVQQGYNSRHFLALILDQNKEQSLVWIYVRSDIGSSSLWYIDRWWFNPKYFSRGFWSLQFQNKKKSSITLVFQLKSTHQVGYISNQNILKMELYKNKNVLSEKISSHCIWISINLCWKKIDPSNHYELHFFQCHCFATSATCCRFYTVYTIGTIPILRQHIFAFLDPTHPKTLSA